MLEEMERLARVDWRVCPIVAPGTERKRGCRAFAPFLPTLRLVWRIGGNRPPVQRSKDPQGRRPMLYPCQRSSLAQGLDPKRQASALVPESSNLSAFPD